MWRHTSVYSAKENCSNGDSAPTCGRRCGKKLLCSTSGGPLIYSSVDKVYKKGLMIAFTCITYIHTTGAVKRLGKWCYTSVNSFNNHTYELLYTNRVDQFMLEVAEREVRREREEVEDGGREREKEKKGSSLKAESVSK